MKKVAVTEVVEHRCGECSHVTPVYRFHTLNVYGLPTLGTCPYWKASRCVLLSQKSCSRFVLKL